MFPYQAGAKMLVCSSDGRGFIAPQDEMIAGTQGQAAAEPRSRAKMRRWRRSDGDHVAIIGENRKLLVFALDQVPEMARGKGVACSATRTAARRTRGSSLWPMA